MAKFEDVEILSVTVRLVRADGRVVEHTLPRDGEALLEARFSIDRPLVLDGATENGVQKRVQGPVSFIQLSAVVRRKG